MGSLFGKQGVAGVFDFGKKGMWANMFNRKGWAKSFIGKPEDAASSGGGTQTPASPSVRPEEGAADEDPEKMKRIGRAALITSTQRGVLTDAETNTKKLFGV